MFRSPISLATLLLVALAFDCHAQDAKTVDSILAEASLRYENILRSKDDVQRAYEESSLQAVKGLERELANADLLKRIEQVRSKQEATRKPNQEKKPAVNAEPPRLPADVASASSLAVTIAPEGMQQRTLRPILPSNIPDQNAIASPREKLRLAMARLCELAEEMQNVAQELSELSQSNPGEATE